MKGARSRLGYLAFLLAILTALLTFGCAAASGGGGSGQLSSNPPSLNFGDVTVGTSSTLTVDLTNTGTASVTVTQANVSGAAFSLVAIALPQTLGPGQSRSFSIRFAPSAVGNATGTVSVLSNASNSPTTVSLTGNGVSAGAHSVDLTWDASTSVVVGYNVYRGNQAGGPYTKLNSSPMVATSYTDSTVLGGRTYFYVTTAVDAASVESVFSNEAVAAIPTP